jgi:amino acid adenylation domain-containing protein
LAALLHQDLPFDALVEALQPPHDASRNPLVQAMFVLQPDPWQHADWGALTVKPLEVDAGGARLDLLLSVWEGNGTLSGCVEYATDLFAPATISRLTEQLGLLLEAALDAPATRVQDLPLLSPTQRQLQLQAWNDTAGPAPVELLHQGFERQAALRPDALALMSPDCRLTFAELERAANRVARALRARGAGRGSDVALMLPRSVDLVVAMLGVLKSGAAYVPLEPGLPAARAARILNTLSVRQFVTTAACLEQVRALLPDAPSVCELLCVEECTAFDTAPLRAQAAPGDVAYTIFTSGSTGVPKGVRVQHAPVVNLCDWVNRSFDVGPGDRLLFVTSPSFDLSVYDVFGALGAGATVRIAGDAEVQDPQRLHRVLVDEGITFWDSAPAALQQLEPLFESPAEPPPALRLVFLSGDWIPVRLPDAVRRAFPRAEVISLGGATEAAIWSNVFQIGRIDPAWASIPYGRPIRNARYYVLNARLQPQPVGVTGDLYIGGDCLALSYAAAPALTAERFIPDPFHSRPGARMYRTGDLARFEADGTLIFLGRSDFQVKVRGFRVEIGEIEAVLAQHPAVTAVAVVTRAEMPGNLLAYVVSRAPVDSASLRAHAAQQLPAYMLPAIFIQMDALPLNANGKLDRHALPAPTAATQIHERIAPRDELETEVHLTWAAVLGHADFGVTENFFEIGGHSLGAFQVVSRLRETHGVELPLRTLFESPTVQTVTAFMRTAQALAAQSKPMPTPAAQPALDLADLLEDIEATAFKNATP